VHVPLSAPDSPIPVLVADDDDGVRFMLATVLRRFGFNVQTAVDGGEAIAQLEAAHYDALVLDLMMPRVSGTDVLRYLNANQPDMLRRTVVVTAHLQSYDDALFEAVGRVVRKPFDIQQLVQTVHECATR
jgi:CheY-like chemotaxis protein